MVEVIEARDRLIVALDCDRDEGLALARELASTVRWLKVGMTLFYQEGPAVVEELRALGYDLFLDLKLHDIPHQVRGAADSIARLGVGMFTVHASGGTDMIRAARTGAAQGAAAAGVTAPSVLAVTVLTSIDDRMLAAAGVPRGSAEQVGLLARLAFEAGADGIVCSPLEASAVRAIVGSDALVVTPGVRPRTTEKGDQQRVMAPGEACARGASHLVVGRPITQAESPVAAAREIIAEMGEASS